MDPQNISQEMTKAIEHMKSEFSKLRVGRASTSMVDSVKVDVYGNLMSLKEVATVNTPDAKTISIQPWDRGVINDIEKAILAANLGLTPINDGKIIRINMPPITEERRKDFVKQIKKAGEDTKVSLRNIRRDAMDSLKANKAGVSEDESKKKQDQLQKTTDQFVAEVDKLVEAKSKEVMTL
jgi:ribosome recycling factor